MMPGPAQCNGLKCDFCSIEAPEKNIWRPVEALARGGHIAIVRFLQQDFFALKILPLMLKLGTIHTVGVGSRENFEKMVVTLEASQIHPVIDIATLNRKVAPDRPLLFKAHITAHHSIQFRLQMRVCEKQKTKIRGLFSVSAGTERGTMAAAPAAAAIPRNFLRLSIVIHSGWTTSTYKNINVF